VDAILQLQPYNHLTVLLRYSIFLATWFFRASTSSGR